MALADAMQFTAASGPPARPAVSRGSTPSRSIVHAAGSAYPVVSVAGGTSTGIAVPVSAVDSAKAWRWLRLYRDVVAKRAVEQHLAKKRRKAQGGRPRRIVTFATLSCCQENQHLMTNYGRAEKEFNALLAEFRGIARARDEEVKQLSSEIAALRQQLREQDAILDRVADRHSMNSAAAALEVQSLLSQLIAQRTEIEDVRGQVLVAQRGSAQSRPDQLSRSSKGAPVPVFARSQPGSSPASHPLPDAAYEGLARARSLLLQRTVQLHGPATRAMCLFGQQPLPDLPAESDKDPSLHSAWLQGFGTGLRGLQLRAQG